MSGGNGSSEKFCTECKWSSNEGGYSLARPRALWACRNELVGSKIDVVDGKRLLVDCHVARGGSGQCLPHGRFWEAKGHD